MNMYMWLLAAVIIVSLLITLIVLGAYGYLTPKKKDKLHEVRSLLKKSISELRKEIEDIISKANTHWENIEVDSRRKRNKTS